MNATQRHTGIRMRAHTCKDTRISIPTESGTFSRARARSHALTIHVTFSLQYIQHTACAKAHHEQTHARHRAAFRLHRGDHPNVRSPSSSPAARLSTATVRVVRSQVRPHTLDGAVKPGMRRCAAFARLHAKMSASVRAPATSRARTKPGH